MKKLLLLFILSALLPLHASAKDDVEDYADYGVNNILHPYMDDKKVILDCAETARAYANVHLEKAASLLEDLKQVKDWRLKERLQVLIVSFISTAPISDPRAKVLTAALALLSDLIINEGLSKCEIAYQIYVELSYAATCLAECQYYNQLSLKALNSGAVINQGWAYANLALDWLTEADMLTICLEKRTTLGYKGIGDQLSHYIFRIRKALMADMLQNRRLTQSHFSDMETLIENYEETVAEVPRRNKALIKQIRYMLNQALINLVAAEKEWRIKQ